MIRYLIRRLGPALAFSGPALARAQEAGAAALPRDLSPWGMVADADPVVKGVLGLLLLASMLTWTIGLAKGVQLLRARRAARIGVDMLRGAAGLAGAASRVQTASECGALVQVAVGEGGSSAGLASMAGIKERAAWRLDRELNAAGRRMSAGTGILATVGSVSPFVGLFGTVWGIMRSFIGISRAQTTNLAVVAPGIAEALLATAVGLVAAIPAVLAYNKFNTDLGRYADRLDNFAAEFSAILLRHLEAKS